MCVISSMDNKPDVSEEFETKKTIRPGGFFGPTYTITKKSTSEELSQEKKQEEQILDIPETTQKSTVNFSERMRIRRANRDNSVKFCEMCGKISSQCTCGYSK